VQKGKVVVGQTKAKLKSKKNRVLKKEEGELSAKIKKEKLHSK